MIGNNIIMLNPASTNEALSEYLNKRFSLPGKVIEVISVEGPSNSYGPDEQFKVTFNILEDLKDPKLPSQTKRSRNFRAS